MICMMGNGNVSSEYMEWFAQEYKRNLKPEDENKIWAIREWDYSMGLYNVELSKYDIVLDIGCGASYFIMHIAKSVRKVIGIDNGTFNNCPDWFETLPSFPQYIDGKVEVITQNAAVLPFPDKHFDKVFTFSALEHFVEQDDIACSKEVHRVLKDNGIFCGTVDFNPLTERPMGKEHFCRVYTYNSFFERVVKPAGFRLQGKDNYVAPNPDTVHYIAVPLFFSLVK